MSSPQNAHRGLSVRDLNRKTPRGEDEGRKVSKTPFRSTPRPPSDWAAASRVVFVSPAEVESTEAAADGLGAVGCVPPVLLDRRLRCAVDQWKFFRAARLRHVGLLMQVSPSFNLEPSFFLRVSACEHRFGPLVGTLVADASCFWGLVYAGNESAGGTAT